MNKMNDFIVKFGQQENLRRSKKFSSRGSFAFCPDWTIEKSEWREERNSTKQGDACEVWHGLRILVGVEVWPLGVGTLLLQVGETMNVSHIQWILYLNLEWEIPNFLFLRVLVLIFMLVSLINNRFQKNHFKSLTFLWFLLAFRENQGNL